MQKLLIILTILAGLYLFIVIIMIGNNQNKMCEKLEQFGDNYCNL